MIPERAGSWRGRMLVDASGAEVGELVEFYADDRDGRPWAAVQTGARGSLCNLVPLAAISPDDPQLRVAVTRRQVVQAPSVRAGALLSVEEERRLFVHYGLDYERPGPSVPPRDG